MLIKEKSNKTNITRYYRIQKVDSNLTALKWNKPFIIGVDLRSNLIYLTIRKSNQVNIELIEQKLKILE